MDLDRRFTHSRIYSNEFGKTKGRIGKIAFEVWVESLSPGGEKSESQTKNPGNTPPVPVIHTLAPERGKKLLSHPRDNVENGFNLLREMIFSIFDLSQKRCTVLLVIVASCLLVMCFAERSGYVCTYKKWI